MQHHDYCSKQASSTTTNTHINTHTHCRAGLDLPFYHMREFAEMMQLRHKLMDAMFVENTNIQNLQPHHELCLRARPYVGERPTVAGFLIYPDAPAKMATTSQDDFCLKNLHQHQHLRGKGHRIVPNSRQQSQRSLPTSSGRTKASRQTGRGSSIKDGEPEEDEGEQEGRRTNTAGSSGGKREMQSQYQKDFAPVTPRCRRRTPALPQPDNIGINPAFRFEFRTVQRETYPSWAVVHHRRPDSMRDVQI